VTRRRDDPETGPRQIEGHRVAVSPRLPVARLPVFLFFWRR